MQVFVQTLAAAAERTRVRRGAGGKRFQRPHVDADQLVGSDPDKICQRAIDAQHVVLLVMDHDEIADGIEHIQPVPVRLLHAGKQSGILQSDAGVAGDGAQQLLILEAGRGAAVGETKHTDEFSRRTG